ncbi:phage antirepressor KilAC domain-containing protein [Clostridioides sp. ZZV14-6153]|uniref:phage antirepressor n=1 Tax=Clostridioides sp. ZZV14-6153 TaxID=2811494 RepID=UPI001D10084E|nr:phage antirepressor KilAC domain-containing protein [Clostridioides sp. ZZV14-6153]
MKINERKNEVISFDNDLFGEVRFIEVDGKPYALATDIAKVLGYKNPHDAISRHCKGVVKHEFVDITGFEQLMNIIPEGDIYRLIIRSKLPSAEKFESWIMDDILPTIRKHGTYLTDTKIEEILSNPDTIIKLATDLKEEREKRKALELTNNKQQQIIGELKPKADYTDLILRNKGLVTITQIAKDYGMSGKAMNKKLHELGIQFKQSGQWLLYSDYQSKGYTHSETINIVKADGTPDIKMNTKWTQKGRLMIYKKLKSIGVLPTIELEEVC